jgi:hypothetical protein
MYRSPISKGRTEVPTSVEDVVEACGEGRRRVSYEKRVFDRFEAKSELEEEKDPKWGEQETAKSRS